MEDTVVYAGFWIRVVAHLIDAILILALITPVLYLIYGAAYFDSEELVVGGADFLLSWVFPAVAVITFWWLKSATPGKMVFSMVIVDARTGAKPSVYQYVLRYVAYAVSIVPLCLGLIWVAIDSRKQGWHDKIANTVVVRKEGEGPPATFDEG